MNRVKAIACLACALAGCGGEFGGLKSVDGGGGGDSVAGDGDVGRDVDDSSAPVMTSDAASATDGAALIQDGGATPPAPADGGLDALPSPASMCCSFGTTSVACATSTKNPTGNWTCNVLLPAGPGGGLPTETSEGCAIAPPAWCGPGSQCVFVDRTVDPGGLRPTVEPCP
ncbi:MAG: hypothetical protein ACREU5_06925 [Burkholderiales bacterium]